MAAGGGPGAAELAWSPGAAPRGAPPELGLKLGALGALLLLPLGCGLGPLCCLRHPPGTADLQSPGLSLLSCFAGGVLLGTCLLDLLPSYLAGIAAALDELRVPLEFPLPEFILAMGFFLVLVLEQAALAQQDTTDPSRGGEDEDEEDTTAAARALLPAGTPRNPPGSPNPPSPLRSGLLVLALALHGALEGLALGLQEAGGAALRLCLALLLHKGLVAFSLALQLLRGRLRRGAVAACLLLFALTAPLGVAVGLAVTGPVWGGGGAGGLGPRQRLCRSVLEGLAAGTFLYVAFLEVLPRELGGGRLRVPKVLALLGGFGLVTAVLFIRI